jgi:hypothetical protein
MKFEHVVGLFETAQNVLVPPRKWEDPFENFILKSPVGISGELGDFAFHDDFYGQCWTLHTASDAMWRIYSPTNRAIRLKTTIRKLYEGLNVHVGGEGPFAHIGKVRYLKKGALGAYLDGGVSLETDASGIADTLLVKRWAFQHEKEVRLLHQVRPGAAKPEIYRYPVAPHILVEQMMIDPRLDKKEADLYKKVLRYCTNFKGDIKRSLLYAPPKGYTTKIATA